MKTDDPKEKGRLRRRNMMAKHMLENRRQYGERVVNPKKFSSHEPNFNKDKILKGIYDEDE